ncbi:MAG: YfiR family protein [Vicinamibacterales bacterium]
MKAAFVRNFLAFVYWPATRFQAGDNLLMCVYNDSPVTSRLNAMTFDAARGHRVQVRTISTCARPLRRLLRGLRAGSGVDGDWRHQQPLQGERAVDDFRRGSGAIGAVLNMYESQGRMTFDVDLVETRRYARRARQLQAVRARSSRARERREGVRDTHPTTERSRHAWLVGPIYRFARSCRL